MGEVKKGVATGPGEEVKFIPFKGLIPSPVGMRC